MRRAVETAETEGSIRPSTSTHDNMSSPSVRLGADGKGQAVTG
jgi:hypothetical protein